MVYPDFFYLDIRRQKYVKFTDRSLRTDTVSFPSQQQYEGNTVSVYSKHETLKSLSWAFRQKVKLKTSSQLQPVLFLKTGMKTLKHFLCNCFCVLFLFLFFNLFSGVRRFSVVLLLFLKKIA